MITYKEVRDTNRSLDNLKVGFPMFLASKIPKIRDGFYEESENLLINYIAEIDSLRENNRTGAFSSEIKLKERELSNLVHELSDIQSKRIRFIIFEVFGYYISKAQSSKIAFETFRDTILQDKREKSLADGIAKLLEGFYNINNTESGKDINICELNN